MTMLANSNNNSSGGGYRSTKQQQVFPVDYEAQVSQQLVDAAHANDLKAAFECITDPFVDVNFVGTVHFKSRITHIILHDETPIEVAFDFQEFKTDVTALFLAAHAGNLTLLTKLLSVGADVNQKLFRGYAITAAVKEGHIEILRTILNTSGVSQLACEEALLEASYLGRAKPVELLMGVHMIRSHVAVHALVTASSRGFVHVVDTLIKCGVDANATARVLLRSSKPSLHANVDCNALVAAIVSRQVAVVQLLLQKGGARTDTMVRLGAWSWDTNTTEEFRVGAGLADPYNIAWCAVEYFEASGTILRLLLQHISHSAPHLGRTIIHHAILCGNARAVEVLLNCGANVEELVKTTEKIEFRPIHLAVRLGFADVLQHLISAGCNLNSKTESDETALMISVRYKRAECVKMLASAGADLGLLTLGGQCAKSIARMMQWTTEFQNAILDVVKADKVPHSSNMEIFSPLIYVTQANDTAALEKLLEQPGIDVDEQDENGFSAVMVAAAAGHMEAFRLLVYAGANVKLSNKCGVTAITLSEANPNSDAFEKVMLDYALGKGNDCCGGYYALHRAACRGDVESVGMLTSGGYDVNIPDSDGYTPLMLAAKNGHGSVCAFLISCGANIDIENARHETALQLARKNGLGNEAEGAILDEVARVLVLEGACVRKYRREGKRSPHTKLLKMVGDVGVLRWGKSGKRNVICRGAEVGPSSVFKWNRIMKKKNDADESGIFRVVTTQNREFHFVCDGGTEMAELWVRGIKLVTREAIFGNK